MNLHELIEELEAIAAEMGDEQVEVHFAQQPNYPLENYVDSVVCVEFADRGEHIVYIGEGHQIGYLPQEAADELGW